MAEHCPSRHPVLTWPNTEGRMRGKCECGFEGWLQTNGRMFAHARNVAGFSTPSIVRYERIYSPVSFLVLCGECGTVVGDEDVHDEWHQSVVDDLNLLRRQLKDLEPEEVTTAPA